MHDQAGVEERIGFRTALIRVPGPYRYWCRQPPLGLASLCAYLKASGLECRVFDAQYNNWTKYELIKRIAGYRPHLVGLTAMTHEIHEAARIGERIKAEIRAPLVVGGPHVTALPRRTLSEFRVFDFGINGEGEKPLLGLAEWLRDGRRDIKEIAGSISLDPNGVLVYSRPSAKYLDGIIHRERDGITINARPPPFSSMEMDGLPFPDFDDYYGIGPEALKPRHARCPVSVSRGTPNRSRFSLPVLGREVRWRSAENVLREMERAVCRWGAHTFDFCDEALVYDGEEPRMLLGLLVEKDFGGPVRWSASARAGLITGDLVKLAKRAGCYRLRMDVGSGDDGILKTSGRQTTVDRLRREVGAIKDSGIEVEAFFTLGHPGETEQQIRRTVDLVTELNPAGIGINLIVPYPGTGIYEMAMRGAGGYEDLSDDWSRYAWYGGKVVGIGGLAYRKLARWRWRAVVGLYLKNRRPVDFLRYLWMRRSALGFVMERKLGIKLVAKERFTG
jgi:radical SAM superfamily enzyme YgiQ (UPF0313 family)